MVKGTSLAFAIISFSLLCALSFGSVPLPIQAQIIPLTTLLAILFLPFTIMRISITPLFKMIVLFAVFVLLHSVVALFIDLTALGAEEVRVLAWARQVTALVAGLSVFLVLRRALIYVTDKFIIHALIIGALPALVVALLNVFWGLTGSSLAGNVVTAIRSTLTKGSIISMRASGLSLEPSFFALYLTTIVIPTIFVAFTMFKRKLLWLTLAVFTLIAFTWTGSVTGLVVLLTLMLIGRLLGPRRDLFTIAVGVTLVSVSFFIHLFPSNYAVAQIHSLLSGNWTVSIIDRFYSTVGPVIRLFSSYTSLGYGLGGITTHFSEVVPAFAQPAIASVRWEAMPNLGSLIGRVLAETGLMGLLLFAMIIFISVRELKYICRESTDRLEIFFLKVARLSLFAFLVGSAIGHGSFALPYLWFWLAVIDSRYINLKRKTPRGNDGY